MNYTTSFFERYAEYTIDPVVRANHAQAFMWFARAQRINLEFATVLDLGCGLGEYGRYGAFGDYMGIDKFVNEGLDANFVQADYLTHDLGQYQPTVIVSLFSTECMLSYCKRYDFYEALFEKYPTIQSALVAGFYYGSKDDQALVEETGGIESYQSIEPLHVCKSDVFTESRLVMHTPSKMFGDDVYEVFKCLQRRL